MAVREYFAMNGHDQRGSANAVPVLPAAAPHRAARDLQNRGRRTPAIGIEVTGHLGSSATRSGERVAETARIRGRSTRPAGGVQ
jgi:hypothetical protein